MTTHNTRNPLGSTAVKDVLDNAENLDRLVNDQTTDVWDDRLGRPRKTWRGIEKQAQLDIAAAVEEGTAAAEILRDESEQARDAAQEARADAVAAAGAAGPAKFFSTYADFIAGIATVPADGAAEIARDETLNGARTRYSVVGGAPKFEANLDQTRMDLADPAKGPEMTAFDGQKNYAVATIGAAVSDICVNVRSFPWLVKGDGSDEWAAIQAALNAGGPGATILFPHTATSKYGVSAPLRFYGGQTWVASGGINLLGKPLEIRLLANASAAVEPANLSATTYGFSAKGFYFNAQGFGDAGLSLYNTSYANIDQCAANATKAGAAAILLDSDTSKQCYFNTINQPRTFASGVGGAGIRFTRGANANQVFGGKCGSSYRGMEFLDLSSGNLVLATDFEENSNCHVYVDAANNVFSATHMEVSPVGFDITAKGTNTHRMNTTFATNTVIAVRDESKIGTVLDTRIETTGVTGDLRFGPARFKALYLTGTSRLEYDPDLNNASSSAIVQLFRNTATTGARQLLIYRGDGSGTYTFFLDAATGNIQCEDIAQGPGQAGAGVTKRLMRRAAVPTTGTFSVGETIKRTAASAAGPVTEWTCTVAGTPGSWQASAWVVAKGSTASRPVLTVNDSGVQYFDTTLAAAGKPIWWTGVAWVDALGGAV